MIISSSGYNIVKRWARVTFQLDGRGSHLIDSFLKRFKATFENGQPRRPIFAKIDNLDSKRIYLDKTYTGTFYFGSSKSPIIKIEFE